MEISIEELKSLEEKVFNEIDHENEPIDLFRDCINIFDKVVSDEAKFPDENTSNYFYENFLYEVIKIALKSKHFKNDTVIFKITL